MRQNKKRKTLHTIRRFVLGSAAISVLVIANFVRSSPPVAQAQSITELRARSAQLEADIAANNKVAKEIGAQADSLQKAVSELDLQISQASNQIELTNVKISDLEKQLIDAQVELDRQKDLLKANMRALYKKAGASTVELLVASDSFSQFINDQEYLERLKISIQESTEKVIELKQQIQTQQEEQKVLLTQQEAAKKSLNDSRQARDRLLQETRGEEARYKARTSQLKADQAKLLAEIVARSRVLTNIGTGDYEWGNYRSGSWTHAGSCNYGDDHDPWGYCYRQCTSFAAWRLYAAGKQPPMYYGNAENWDNRAAAAGIPTGKTPKVGAIAVWGGYEGHVAYVEEIRSDGVRISEYNAVPALQGRYSQRIIAPGDPDNYIYF